MSLANARLLTSLRYSADIRQSYADLVETVVKRYLLSSYFPTHSEYSNTRTGTELEEFLMQVYIRVCKSTSRKLP